MTRWKGAALVLASVALVSGDARPREAVDVQPNRTPAPRVAVLAPDIQRVIHETPRRLFVPAHMQETADLGRPIAVSDRVKVPSPHVAGRMLSLLQPQLTHTALEIGTGTGYQTALLAQLVAHVYSIEISPETADEARDRLAQMGHSNVEVMQGNGRSGWMIAAPFDRIIMTVAPREIPPALIEQLAVGGRMVAPVGPPLDQVLVVAEKKADGTLSWNFAGPVVAPPMVSTINQNSR